MDGDEKELPESREEEEETQHLRERFAEAREYGRLRDAQAEVTYDPRLEALVPFARGEKKVALHADNAQTILFALKFIEEQGLDAVLYGVREGWKVAGAIARAGVPVVVGPVLSVPRSEFDPYDAAYSNPAVLARAGVHVAIMANDGANTRNTPFHAGFASAFGLPREEALRSVTYYAAEVLGLESQLGSLAPGKLADVVITRGDLLETTTPVDAVFIDGALQDVKNRQTRLYERYRDRLHRLEAE